MPTPQEVEQLKAQAEKAKEYHDMLLRTAAEFDNYKKRVAREKQESAKLANKGSSKSLFQCWTILKWPSATGNSQTASVQSLQTGVNMILQQFRSALKETGLEEINAAGQKFDPNLHEALSQQESSDVPEGHVLQQLRKGYKLRDRGSFGRPASSLPRLPRRPCNKSFRRAIPSPKMNYGR